MTHAKFDLAKPPVWLLLSLRLVVVAGLDLSVYLTVATANNVPVVGCTAGTGCDYVLNSSWAKWWGMPVAGFAAVIYALLLVGSIMMEDVASPFRLRLGRQVVSASMALLLASVGWFVFLQFYVIGALCRLCMASHSLAMLATSLALLSLCLRSVEKSEQEETEQTEGMEEKEIAFGDALPDQKDHPSRIWLAFGLGLLLAVVGMVGHWLQPRSLPVLPLTLGSLEMDLSDQPVLGNTAAIHRIVFLHDFNCHYCRELFDVLDKMLSDGQSNFALVPIEAPLGGDCNPDASGSVPAYAESCALARMTVALKASHPDHFADWCRWLEQGKHAPTPAEAQDWLTQKGIELSDTQTDAITEQIQQQIAWNYAARQIVREQGHNVGNGVPTLILIRDWGSPRQQQTILPGPPADPELLKHMFDSFFAP